jgi:serine phosphatase RsbU (regulator of sigma subunit)
LRKNDPDSGIKVADTLIQRSRRAKNKKWEAYGFNARASNFYNKASYDSAIASHEEALRIRRAIGDRKTEAQSLGNLGLVYERKLDYTKAIDYHLQSLSIKEELNDSLGMSNSYGNIGNIFMFMKQSELALEYMQKCYDIKVKSTDTANIALVRGNLGNIYSQLNDTVNSLREYSASLELWKAIGDEKGQALTLNNVGNVYEGVGLPEKAFEAYRQALDLRRGLNDPHGIASSLGNLAVMSFDLGEMDNAEKYARESLLICDTLNAHGSSLQALETMSKIFAKRGDSNKELYYYKEYIKVRDSVRAIDAEKDVARKEIAFEYTKKAAADSVKNAEEQKLKDLEIAAQNTKLEQEAQQRYFLYGGLILVVAFAGFVWNRFTVTRKQKGIIEQQKTEVEGQKHIIEEKQKEILDSITYAKRLQEAILPAEEQFLKLGKDRFLLYKPKDIVAGDFYFLEEVGEYLFAAAADSTGHGVPGAMVSVVCSNALTRAVRELKITDPGKILDTATDIILDTFGRNKMEVKDGMDISLCSIHLPSGKISWAGAHNSLWIAHANGEFEIVDANKQPVGKYEYRAEFTTREVSVASGDMIYLFTDGYSDQFGGEKGKKFKAANFRKLLSEISATSCAEQQAKINSEFEKWKGNYEQVDDVCVMGVRV